MLGVSRATVYRYLADGACRVRTTARDGPGGSDPQGALVIVGAAVRMFTLGTVVERIRSEKDQ